MSGFALDTNIVSAHLRGDVAVGAQIRANTRLYLPVTVLGELFYGAYHTEHCDKQLACVRSFLPLVQTVHHDDEIAERYGKVKARLAELGSMIPENDLWIAATCLVHDLTLASRDAHFEVVEGLSLVRWEAGSVEK
jgi:tRNA(fMet)-specific endonuclease VapC